MCSIERGDDGGTAGGGWGGAPHHPPFLAVPCLFLVCPVASLLATPRQCRLLIPPARPHLPPSARGWRAGSVGLFVDDDKDDDDGGVGGNDGNDGGGGGGGGG